MLDDITPVILTYNEAPNIGRTLQALTWAKHIIVVDSFSDDETKTICQQFDNVTFVQRKFDEHASQWNAAIEQPIYSEWVLALDADYVVSQPLKQEIAALNPAPDTHGYWIDFVYKINGKALRGSLYPAHICLFRSQSGHYQQDGHTQRLSLNGKTEKLTNPIYHDDRKPDTRWHQSQRRYAKQEAIKLRNTPFKHLSITDKLRHLGLGPIAVLPFTLFMKGLILDGRAGFQYAKQRLSAECYIFRARFGLL